WMSADEVLVMVPEGERGATLDRIGGAMAGTHTLVADVSDARALFRIDGPAARDVLAKLTPVDLRPGAMGQGDFRRTLVGQVGAAFWMTGPETFEIVCFRSVGDYVWDLLRDAAEVPVGHLAG
ncbi:MAG: sarcosine oxidase subunit gamma, partial [Shimia sp.]